MTDSAYPTLKKHLGENKGQTKDKVSAFFRDLADTLSITKLSHPASRALASLPKTHHTGTKQRLLTLLALTMFQDRLMVYVLLLLLLLPLVC
jgi:hypothetical protein